MRDAANIPSSRASARPKPGEIAAALSSHPAGQVVTSIVLRLAAEGLRVEPRVTSAGARITVPPSLTRGQAELLVTSVAEGSRIALHGQPPPWPFRMGWPRRTLRRMLGLQLSAFE